MRATWIGLVGLLVVACLASGCDDEVDPDCGYSGERGSAQYERDMERAARNGCEPDEIKPFDP